MNHVNTLIIGAGPSGLAMAACLKEKGIEALVLEREAQLGGLYRDLDPDLVLLSPGALSRLPYDDGLVLNNKPTSGQFYDYLVAYSKKHGTALRFHFQVQEIRRDGNLFAVTSNTGETIRCKFVVDATGSRPRSLPNMPDAIPARSIKKTALLPRQKVLIIGSGTSALELAERISDQCDTHIALKERDYFPVYFMGMNTHWLFRWFEVFGRFALNMSRRSFTEKVFYRDFFVRLRQGKIQKHSALPDLRQFDLVVSAIGYEKESNHLSPELYIAPPRKDIYFESRDPHFFILGQKQYPHLDSGFIRGIAKDAEELAQKIKGLIEYEQT
jgi:hypothetical protein